MRFGDQHGTAKAVRDCTNIIMECDEPQTFESIRLALIKQRLPEIERLSRGGCTLNPCATALLNEY